jgi:D-alanine-D-alanine ligase
MRNEGRKIRVGVIFGGRSGEHEVSLASARSVLKALDAEKYEVVTIGITKEGHWIAGDDVTAALASGSTRNGLLPEQARPATSGEEQVLALASHAPAAGSSLAVLNELDVIFPVLHGPYGEDGTVQGLLELAGLAYVGAGVVGSAVGMDKAIFKQVMAANGLPVLPWLLFTRRQWLDQPEASLDEIESQLNYPLFTKPANLGSSVGVTKCYDRDDLLKGLNEASRYDRRVIVEQGIHHARELEVAVLGNDEPQASVVGEVRPRRDFYDYIAKYVATPGSEEESELIIPADISPALSDEVRKVAVRAYRASDCAGMGRVDLLLDPTTSRLYLNEINTIPGFTSISMYPKLWEASGLSYPELLDRLVDLALERHEEKLQLKTSFDTGKI